MKSALSLLFLFIGLLRPARAQSLDDLDEKNGFRDVTFGQTIATVGGLIPLSKSPANSRKYQRPADVLKIDGEPLKSITYTFYRGLLSAVVVKYTTAAARAKLLQSLQLAYGYGVDSTLAAGPAGTIWLGKNVGMVLGNAGELPGELLLTSNLVAGLIKQDQAADYKKRRGGI